MTTINPIRDIKLVLIDPVKNIWMINIKFQFNPDSCAMDMMAATIKDTWTYYYTCDNLVKTEKDFAIWLLTKGFATGSIITHNHFLSCTQTFGANIHQLISKFKCFSKDEIEDIKVLIDITKL